jgi:hypothetical protein
MLAIYPYPETMPLEEERSLPRASEVCEVPEGCEGSEVCEVREVREVSEVSDVCKLCGVTERSIPVS